MNVRLLRIYFTIQQNGLTSSVVKKFVFFVFNVQKSPPVKQRAAAVKAQNADIDAVKAKVDLKEEEIKELRKQYKNKVSQTKVLS